MKTRLVLKRPCLSLLACMAMGGFDLSFQEAVAASPPLPKQYGLYAVSQGKLIELTKDTMPEVTKDVEFILFDKNVSAILLLSGEPKLHRLAFTRYEIVGSSFRGVELDDDTQNPSLKWVGEWVSLKTENSKVKLRSAPIKGEPDMIHLTLTEPLKPGVYALMKQSLRVQFQLDKSEDRQKCFDAYFDTVFERLRGLDAATFRSREVLDQKLDGFLKEARTKDAASQADREKFAKGETARVLNLARGWNPPTRETFSTLVEQARTARREKQYKDVASAYSRILEIDPHNLEALIGSADSEFELENSFASLRSAGLALRKQPRADLFLIVAVNFARLKDTEQTLFWTEKAAKGGALNSTIVKTYFKDYSDNADFIALTKKYIR